MYTHSHTHTQHIHKLTHSPSHTHTVPSHSHTLSNTHTHSLSLTHTHTRLPNSINSAGSSVSADPVSLTIAPAKHKAFSSVSMEIANPCVSATTGFPSARIPHSGNNLSLQNWEKPSRSKCHRHAGREAGEGKLRAALQGTADCAGGRGWQARRRHEGVRSQSGTRPGGRQHSPPEGPENSCQSPSGLGCIEDRTPAECRFQERSRSSLGHLPAPGLAKHSTGGRGGTRWVGPDGYLAPGQDQALHRLLVKELQLLDQVNPGPQAHGLEQPAVSCRGRGGQVSGKGQQGPGLGLSLDLPASGTQAFT